MSFDVFVSYATQDRIAAEKICTMLEERGIKCWIAPRDIMPGGVYSESILDGIDTSFGLVVIVSQNANASTHVRNEVERAVSKGKVIFPVRIENIAPSKALELFVMSSQWVEAWQADVESRLNQLGNALLAMKTNRVAAQSTSAPAASQPHTTAPPIDYQAETVFRSLAEGAWADGTLTDSERQYLSKKAKEFGISTARAKEILVHPILADLS